MLEIIPQIRKLLSYMDKLNLFAFYFNGAYYTLSKRLTGIRYATLINNDTNYVEGGSKDAIKTTFKVLGYLAFVNVCVEAVRDIYKIYKNRKMSDAKTNKIQSHEAMKTNIGHKDSLQCRKCPLCLDIRNYTSATPCGHLFCWNCIMKCVTINPECPICRHYAPPSRVICLQNYI